MSENPESGEIRSNLNIVNSHHHFSTVSLKSPSKNSYIHLAAEVDDPSTPYLRLYLFESEGKRKLIAESKALCRQLSQEEDVVDATVFKALLIPPGRGAYLEQTDEDVHIARFDVSILIEVAGGSRLDEFLENETYRQLEELIETAAKNHHIVSATNVKRIDSVNHDENGVFLFNYFFAEDTEQNIAVWEYTAGWFETKTGLDNSTLLLPDDPDRSEYTLINHCRWDRLLDLLPSLLFDTTFDEYVLANFEANRVAPIPVLYKLA